MVMVPSSVVLVTSTIGVAPVASRGESGALYSSVGCHPVLWVGRVLCVDRDRVVTGPAEDVVPIAVGREDEIVAGASAFARSFASPKRSRQSSPPLPERSFVPNPPFRRSLSLPPSRSSLPSSPSKN